MSNAINIQEFLVSLGVKMDDNGMNKMMSFLKSSKTSAVALGATLTAATTIVYQFIKSAYTMNETVEATARTTGKATETVRASTMALKAMGKTLDEVNKDAKLKKAYDDLVKMNEAMALPASSKGQQAISDIASEAMKIKSTAYYAIQWIYYHLTVKLQKPLQQIRDMLTKFRQGLIVNMPSWTAKVASFLTGAVHMLTTIVRLGKNVFEFIQGLPDEIKTLGVATMALWQIFRASPLTWLIAGMTALLLLIDDYYTYKDGGKSALPGLWKSFEDGTWSETLTEAVDEGIASLTQKLDDFMSGLSGWISTHKDDIEAAATTIGNLLVAGGEILAALVLILVSAISDPTVVNAAVALGTALMDGLLNSISGTFPRLMKALFPDSEIADAADSLIEVTEGENGVSYGVDEDGNFLPWYQLVGMSQDDRDAAIARAKGNEWANVEAWARDQSQSGLNTGALNTSSANASLIAQSKFTPVAPQFLYGSQPVWDDMIAAWNRAKEDKDVDTFKYLTEEIATFQNDYSSRASNIAGFFGSADVADVLQRAQDATAAATAALEKLEHPQIDITINGTGAYGKDGDEEVSFGMQQNATGGRYDKFTRTTLVEDGDPEYVIPVKKPGLAIPLLKRLLGELGTNAKALLNGYDNVVSTGTTGSGGGNVNYYNTINAPTTINVYGGGASPEKVGQAAYGAAESNLVRNLKEVLE